jgi:putative DNA methylase
MTPKKKLIEVALPLEAINKAAAREKSIRHGHPSTLHLWWARRPLAAARAVIFAQMVDDPSAHPDLFPTEKKQEKERQRLFRIIEDLVQWENTTNEKVLQAARDEIWQSWRYACAEHAGHPRAKELFDRHRLPAFHDPFAGGGALPLEAQRLGLEAYASDLNPVAVLINKAMIEIPPKFAGLPPVNPESRKQWIGNSNALPRTEGMAEVHGRGERGVSAGTAAAARGNLRHALPDHASGGIDPGEHRGGLDPRIGKGEGAVPVDRPGVAGRDGNIPDALRRDRLVPDAGNGTIETTSQRNWEDADYAQAEIQEIGNSEQKTGSTGRGPPISYSLFPASYRGAEGLAADVRYYGQWMRDEAEKRIGHLYPKVEVTAEMAKERPDLKPYVGQKLTVIAWLWARTVKSPNPAFAQVDVPLASTFMLSTKVGKEAYVEPVIGNRKQEMENSEGAAPTSYSLPPTSYSFTVKVGKPKDAEAAKNGTKLSRGANFRCLMSETPIEGDYIKAEGKAGRMGARMMAIVAEGERGRVYLAPTLEYEVAARKARPEWKPESSLPDDPRNFWTVQYGLTTYGDLFTPANSWR